MNNSTIQYIILPSIIKDCLSRLLCCDPVDIRNHRVSNRDGRDCISSALINPHTNKSHTQPKWTAWVLTGEAHREKNIQQNLPPWSYDIMLPTEPSYSRAILIKLMWNILWKHRLKVMGIYCIIECAPLKSVVSIWLFIATTATPGCTNQQTHGTLKGKQYEWTFYSWKCCFIKTGLKKKKNVLKIVG